MADNAGDDGRGGEAGCGTGSTRFELALLIPEVRCQGWYCAYDWIISVASEDAQTASKVWGVEIQEVEGQRRKGWKARATIKEIGRGDVSREDWGM